MGGILGLAVAGLGLLTGCAGDAATSANTGGSTGLTAGTTGNGGSSVSSTGGTNGGSAQGSSGETNNSGGTLNGVVHCGGNLESLWTGEVPVRPPVPPAIEVNSCWNLMFNESAGGMLSVSARLETRSPDVKRYVTLYFEASAMADVPNVFYLAEEEKGPVTQHFGPECMIYGDRQVTCDELTLPLNYIGLGEGAWRNTVCTAAADGGCDCAMDYWATGGPSGTWELVDERLLLTRDVYSLELGTSQTVTSSPIDYCVSEDTVRFGTAIDEVRPLVAGHPLTRIDCTDGVQGPGEDGVDCGYRCPEDCALTP